MPIFSVPGWVRLHQFKGKKYSNLSLEEINDLKKRLANFAPSNPDISVVIPAWNEGDNIFRTLSSLADTKTTFSVEILVINNNSSDHTSKVLNDLGVRNYLQPLQGTPFARQLGLELARGKYHLCADADTFYPPQWVNLMVKPLMEAGEIVGIYGRYSFLPPDNKSRFCLAFYEKITGLLIRLRRVHREHINFLGFNMGFLANVGKENGGFKVKEARKFDNAIGSNYFVDEAEDGRMALNLLTKGRLKLITDRRARVFTSSRRLTLEGGITKSFTNRLRLHASRLLEYTFNSRSEN